MEEMEEIAELAKKYDAFVITDEVYEYIVYGDNRHISMAALPGMYERTITCSSLSKTYSMTGWRLGYLIGPEHVIEAAKKVHDFLTAGAAAPLQEAAVTGLKFGPAYYQWLKDLYTEKRDYLCGRLEQMGLPTRHLRAAILFSWIFRDSLRSRSFPAGQIWNSVNG